MHQIGQTKLGTLFPFFKAIGASKSHTFKGTSHDTPTPLFMARFFYPLLVSPAFV